MWYIQGIVGLREHVPKVHKVFRDLRTRHIFIIMDYIEGSNLYKIWSLLSAPRQHGISEEISAVIRTIQRNVSQYPGPLGLSQPQVFLHPRYAPPVGLGKQGYEAYLNFLIDIVNTARGLAVPPLSHVAVPRVVLGNMQLDPGSFIRDKVGWLWVVGWGKSGFYAPEAEIALCVYLMPARFYPVSSVLSKSWNNRRNMIIKLVAVASYLDKGIYVRENLLLDW
ncbi:hypothetical protein F4814DRAFT_431845 [Daldinia grandis]|nr:hypothetical protein F4814DRAFT_431845 [Daldinia grandis]